MLQFKHNRELSQDVRRLDTQHSERFKAKMLRLPSVACPEQNSGSVPGPKMTLEKKFIQTFPIFAWMVLELHFDQIMSCRDIQVSSSVQNRAILQMRVSGVHDLCKQWEKSLLFMDLNYSGYLLVPEVSSMLVDNIKYVHIGWIPGHNDPLVTDGDWGKAQAARKGNCSHRFQFCVPSTFRLCGKNVNTWVIFWSWSCNPEETCCAKCLQGEAPCDSAVMAAGLKYPLPPSPLPLPPPEVGPPPSPVDSMTGGRQGGQGRIDEQERIDDITDAARDFALQLPWALLLVCSLCMRLGLATRRLFISSCGFVAVPRVMSGHCEFQTEAARRSCLRVLW